MTTKRRIGKWFGVLAAAAMLVGMIGSAQAQPLKVAYSDWPGWVPWEIAKQKGFFEKNGVEVELVWMDYVAGMEAFAAGQVDCAGMTNGDALVTGANSGKPSVAIIINDYSNGNDMIIAKEGIDSLKDLKGKKVGLEVGFVDHLLLLKGLESVGMSESDVELVNVPTNETPQALSSGSADAIGAWYPSSGQALRVVSGSKPIYTSKEAPGLIYDIMYVSEESLATRREDWVKVVKTWYDVVDFLKDPKNKEEALKIMAGRVSVTPEDYASFMEGTKILTLEEAVATVTAGEEKGLMSWKGSTKVADEFNVKYGVYKEPEYKDSYLDASLTLELAKAKGIKVPE